MYLIIILITAIIIYSVQHRLYRLWWDRGLNISIKFGSPYVECGSETFLVESIINDKPLPLPVFHVKLAADRSFRFEDGDNASVTDSYHRNDVFSIMGNEKITRTLKFSSTKRGYYSIPYTEVVAKDFFMTRSFAKQMKNDTSLYVLPQKYHDIGLQRLCMSLMGETKTRRSLAEDIYTFRGIRDYDGKTPMNRINWKATAKTGGLKVNVYDYSSEQKIKILLNLEPNVMLKTHEMQEICISLASSAAFYFLSMNIPVSITAGGIDVKNGDICKTGFGASAEHMLEIDKCLSRIAGGCGLDGFMRILDTELRLTEGSVTYIVISAYCKEDLLLKLDYFNNNNMPVQMIVPYYDIQEMNFNRGYIRGWEVGYDET